MAKLITERQQEIYDFVKLYIEDNGMPPTTMEIKDAFGFKSPQSVVDHLKALKKKGYVDRLHCSRGIVLTKKRFPILGKISAGVPIDVEECFDGNFKLNHHYDPESTFVLNVEGDSMKDAGIYNGDMVFIKPCSDANSGEIVVAVIDGEYTVKRFISNKNTILLKPENESYEPIVIKDKNGYREDFRIIGKVVGVHRVID